MRSFVVALLASASAVALGLSCAPTPQQSQFTQILQPDFKSYHDFVDPFLQRRCGTLDCHGQPGRAYRIYGYTGFRLVQDTLEGDAGTLTSGKEPTTEAEIQANFQAAVSLEPEELTRVIGKQGVDAQNLLLIRKPTRVERHKGGQVIAVGDDGYRCMIAWLGVRTVRKAGPDDDDPSGLGYIIIDPESREALPQAAQTACKNSAALP